MKYAIVRGEKVEARKRAIGYCQICDSALIARCGEVKINHWAHKGKRMCDTWWENETEWHRAWKNKFPKDWQEEVHFDKTTGEKHIADVKTPSGWVLEFQHSYIKPEERRSRNAFYKKLIWIVDGTRRETDRIQFEKILKESLLSKHLPIRKVHHLDECRLLKEWHDPNVFVFFDFKEDDGAKEFPLWFLFPKLSSSEAYLLPYSRVEFIELHNGNNFDEFNQLINAENRRLVSGHNQNRPSRNVQVRQVRPIVRGKRNRPFDKGKGY